MSLAPTIRDKIHKIAPVLARTRSNRLKYSSLQKTTEEEHDLKEYIERLDLGLQEIERVAKRLAPFDHEQFNEKVVAEIHTLTQNSSHLERIALDSLLKLTQKKIHEVLGLSKASVLAIYRIGAEVYNEGRYQEASSVFLIVCLLDGSIHDAWVSLGHAECRNKEFTRAIIAYEMAGECDPQNPLSKLYAAHSYEALGEYENAIDSLEHLIALTDGKIEHKELMQKAKACKERLKGEKR